MAASFVKGSSQSVNLGTLYTWSDRSEGTVSAWWNLGAIAASTEDGIAFGLPNGTVLVTIGTNTASSTIRAFARRLNGDSGVQLIGPTLTLDTWYHVAVTLDWVNGEFRLYVNGELVASNLAVAGWTGNSQSGSSAANRVGSNLGVSTFTTARIQDLRTYLRALTPAEVRHMHAARGGDRILNGLHNRWILNNGAPGGTIGANAVRDYGPGQNHGSGANSPTWAGAPLRTRPRVVLAA